MGRAASSWVLGGGEVLDGLSKPASTVTKQVEAGLALVVSRTKFCRKIVCVKRNKVHLVPCSCSSATLAPSGPPGKSDQQCSIESTPPSCPCHGCTALRCVLG